MGRHRLFFALVVSQARMELALQGAQVELLCEPSGKNTAPCIVFAMEWIRARDPEATVMIVPADHWISEAAEYLKVMKHAVGAAEKSALLITVGIQPTRAESGYGYIRSGERLNDGVYKVDRFVEKPKREVAETMIQDPEYFWNSGMFVWTVKNFFAEAKKSAPELLEDFSSVKKALEHKQNPQKVLSEVYSKIDAISIDYALLEKTKNVGVVPGNFGWNDLGSFVALEEVYAKTEGGVARAKRVLALDSLANIIDCPDKTVALLGITDLIIVDTDDVLLIASRERAQDVKKIVERLRSERNSELL